VQVREDTQGDVEPRNQAVQTGRNLCAVLLIHAGDVRGVLFKRVLFVVGIDPLRRVPDEELLTASGIGNVQIDVLIGVMPGVSPDE
jgi:hypothetical protein